MINKPAIRLHSFDLFSNSSTYIDARRLYYAYHKSVASLTMIGSLNMTQVRKWLEAEYKGHIIKRHLRQEFDWQSNSIKYVDAFYFLENNLLLNLVAEGICILHQQHEEALVMDFVKKLKRFAIRKQKTREIRLVTQGYTGLTTSVIQISKPKVVVKEHYNNDLLTRNEKILFGLKQNNKSGLYLFHGAPGTGKSKYIRHLVRSIKKKVIFIPIGLAANVHSPNFTKLFIKNPNAVFVIEDAEDLIASRESAKNPDISMLLNLTEGLLGESLGIQVIATFNTGIQNIDKALLRKGRLRASYEFKPLDVDKSNALLSSLGFGNIVVKQPATLADIFNMNQDSYQELKTQRPQIGFLARAL